MDCNFPISNAPSGNCAGLAVGGSKGINGILQNGGIPSSASGTPNGCFGGRPASAVTENSNSNKLSSNSSSRCSSPKSAAKYSSTGSDFANLGDASNEKHASAAASTPSSSSVVVVDENVDDPETKKPESSESVCQEDDFDDDRYYVNKSSDKLINPNEKSQTFVNFCDSINQKSGEKELVNLSKNCDSWDDDRGDVARPLLSSYEQENEKKPKSIVKSASTQSFREAPDPTSERPVLHVQFSHANNPQGCPATPTGSVASRVSGSSSSSSSSDEDSQYSEAQALDGGWGWVVVFASFMINVIADGITFSFGVLFVEFSEYFNESKSKTAWIGSFLAAIPLLSGPIASFLTDRYGCRKVTVVGSILAASGFITSAMASSMEILFLTFGILTGFGLSLCYVAAVVIVAYYFDKKRSFATGLSVCGSGIGTSIFAPLIQLLIDEYGWRGTMLVLAGIVLNMCVCGMLMKDLEWTRRRAKLRRKKKRTGTSAESFSVSNSTNTNTGTVGNLTNHDELDFENMSPDDSRLFSSLITLPTYLRNGEKVPLEVLELLSRNKNINSTLIQNYPNLCHSRSFSEPFTSKNNILSPGGTLVPVQSPSPSEPRPKSVLKRTHNWHPHHQRSIRTPPAYLKDLKMHRHSLTYRGAMLNINRYRLRASSCPDIYRNSMTTIAPEKSAWAQGVEDFKDLLMDMLNFSYFGDIRFCLFALSNFLLYTWYDIPYMYISDFAISQGFSEQDGSKLISTIGIINMIGEVALGWAGDRESLNANFIYAICMGMCGLVTALMPLFRTYLGLTSLCGCFGLFIAANYSLTSIILVELITLEKFTNAYGLLLLVQGVANLVGPPLGGFFVDLTGEYNLSFYLAGIFIAISGLLLLILPALGTYKRYKALKKSSLATSDTDTEKTAPLNSKLPTIQEIPSSRSNTILGDCFGKDSFDEAVKV